MTTRYPLPRISPQIEWNATTSEIHVMLCEAFGCSGQSPSPARRRGVSRARRTCQRDIAACQMVSRGNVSMRRSSSESLPEGDAGDAAKKLLPAERKLATQSKAMKRAIANRESARRSKERRKEYLNRLEAAVVGLHCLLPQIGEHIPPDVLARIQDCLPP
eukprot:CAMPEP_0182862008 /NCGR_PEP_ID=MMETSP0034_2-20130328/5818_1 /TAXON_ID=156128 /ORGANISM="Nephroselmis pyriformis, Strain CCMP717" /LENGTH=160 /DNA_ID=CAMNT_0024994009 /DNA_START=96 /DNA_END=574 /DNA_ORIENTATION=-